MLVYIDWLCVVSLDFHICDIWLVFAVLLLVPQLQFGCLSAKLLVVDLKKKSKQKQKQKKKCQGCTIGNYYKLIERIVILEGLE